MRYFQFTEHRVLSRHSSKRNLLSVLIPLAFLQGDSLTTASVEAIQLICIWCTEWIGFTRT